MNDYPNAEGWIYTNDDTFMDVWSLARFNTSKIWYKRPAAEDVADLNEPYDFLHFLLFGNTVS